MNQPTATTKHITATHPTPLIDLLKNHLGNHRCTAIIASGGVWMNQQRITNPHHIIQAKQTIKVYISPTQGYRYAFSKESIINETDDWVVVMKEPLITIGMDRSNQYFNLMAGLNEYYGYRNISKGVQPITRLDYRVSGLALFSKTKQGERYLFKQMQQKRIKKRYQILVSGTNHKHWYRVTNRLNATYKAFKDPNGKLAQTAFVKKHAINGHTLFEVATLTGRRHQIRYHAAINIAPVINDELYGYPSKNQHNPIGLIATQLTFQWNKHIHKIQLPDQWLSRWTHWLDFAGRDPGT